ncbi:MAG: hypothetical protein V4675_17855 [Verrucomicrobiota bacterium]
MSAVPHSPVIVVSPALRAATTLVQRLLCSAPNTLIHGDLVDQDVGFFAKYSSSKEQMTADPAGTVRRQEEHTGSRGISEKVFRVRVNHTGSANCLPPAALTPEEEAALGDPIITLAPHREAA